ncbi:abortive infection system antitoxin AbiGi family protein [Mesorhizobium sp.]|uniref:abortive infection system antitoxin AbiGi family protein n=1 Tax=Mesorhizobium sp. TaxID=1871066 RepID=UPI000FE6C7E8|nr:abortive infection system antitoxin AbiGi family protein [Mesorhizobium sp.]RWO77158.1 MAG: hypothetical protein EOQ96_32225 [Mesorhizobium sp.]
MAKSLEGIRLHPQRRDWDDISDYVAHFTKDAPLQADETQAAHQLVSILRTGTIEARTRWGAGRAFGESPMSVCFSETPIHHLKRVAAKRSQFGLGFAKDFIVRRGGGPVLYAYRDQGDAIASMVQQAVGD